MDLIPCPLPAQLGIYLAVLRKHVLLLSISAALVVAAGVFYVARQEKVYRSVATLVVETPAKSVVAGREYQDQLAQDQDELQTQVFLLRLNRDLARDAVSRLKEKGIDVAAGDYTEETLPARVRVEFIPGTRAVSFSLTGPDARTLPEAVNTYAKVYQEWSEDKSARLSKANEDQLDNDAKDAEAKLRRLRQDQDAIQKEEKNKDLNLAGGENPYAAAWKALQEKMPALEAETQGLKAARQTIVAALDRIGVEAVAQGLAYSLRANAGDGPALEARLVADERIVALPCVRGNDVVQHWRERERDFRTRDHKLEEADYLVTHPDRMAARKDAVDAEHKRGAATAGAIETELASIETKIRENENVASRLTELKDEASRVNAVLLRYREKETEIESQKREVARANEKLTNFRQAFLREVDSTGRASQATRRIVMHAPAVVAEQIAPKVPLIIGLTAFAAIAVGLGLVLLFEYFDDTVKSKEDFDRYVGLPFLGFIPRIEGKDAANPDLAADAKTGSATAEAFRAVRTSILFSRGDKPVRSILVTSAGPGEGKTTVATNLAITLAKHKGPILLVDADLRRPRIAKALGIENKLGLTNFLIGEATLDEVVQKTSIDGLFAIASGPIPPNPAELLHGERLAELMKLGLERFDRIVIDSPPVIAVSDARVIARCADGLYLVISMGRTSWRLIQRSLESLTSIGFDVQGAILNNLAEPTGRYGYYYYRDYAYGKGYYVQPSKDA